MKDNPAVLLDEVFFFEGKRIERFFRKIHNTLKIIKYVKSILEYPK